MPLLIGLTVLILIYIIVVPARVGTIIHKEFNATCDNGYTTGWMDRSYMEENVLYSRLDGIHTYYVVPEDITCTIIEKRTKEND